MRSQHLALSHTDWGQNVREFVLSQLPEGDFRHVMIKPNWVKHAEHPEFPIEALVTDSRLVAATIDACREAYPRVESIRIGDVPLQSCDWDRLCAQARIGVLQEQYASDRRISFHDLRRERWRLVNGFMERDPHAPGDPLGYHEVALDEISLLEEVSHNSLNFRVSDYDPEETVSVHQRGRHRYLIARSVLDADLFINLPKMKSHQKSGITGALKNLVGINGSKAHLVHHQKGRPSSGGDEFPQDAAPVIRLQSMLRESLQKRSRILFQTLRLPWQLYKRLAGLSTVATREALRGRVYVGAGSWYGNDSIWRMVYDLNLIVRFATIDAAGLSQLPQRETLSILDGIVAGEGNGPLQPLPVQAGVLVASSNPFLVDLAMARLMGFDHRKIPLVANHARFPDSELGDFDEDMIRTEVDGFSCRGISSIPVVRRFAPPPGWVGHIELPETVHA